jgi:glycosyltransferase involved in cell wall biosynthesis
MRVCIVYDCLYPYTIGGAEHWYRDLAQELARRGHEVTYLTRRQWDRGAGPELEGVRVIGLEPPNELYDRSGRRRIAPTLAFGLGVFSHLLRRGRRYDVVHTASFPYFSLLAASTVRPLHRFRLMVDWHEFWTQRYWRDYLGRWSGRIGWLVQRLCLLPKQQPFCFSELHAERLREYGVNGNVVRLTGQYSGGASEAPEAFADPIVVFAGRQLPEKRVLSLVPAVALARQHLPDLRAQIFGDGPDHRQLERLIATNGLTEVVEAPGFVDSERLVEGLRHALCLALPSRREGYGRVVVEAAAAGAPSVVVRGDENAAVELIEEGVNGFVAPSDAPEDLASAILRVHQAGPRLRETTRAWFAQNAERLSLNASIEQVAVHYGEPRLTSSGPALGSN